MMLTVMKHLLLPLALLAAAATLRAAPAIPAPPAAQLSQFKLGAHITGPKVTIEEAAGKAVLIEAWGINCPPCLASLPDIEKIARRYTGKMLVFGAHSQNGTDQQVTDVVKKKKLSYTITQGVNSPIAFDGIPRVFLFDTKGALVFTGSPFDPFFERALPKAVAGAGPPSGLGGAKPSGLDSLKPLKPQGT